GLGVHRMLCRSFVDPPTKPSLLSKRCIDRVGCFTLHSDSGGIFAEDAVLGKILPSVTFSLTWCIRRVRLALGGRVGCGKSDVSHLADGVRVGWVVDRRDTNGCSCKPPPGPAILSRSAPEIQQNAGGVFACQLAPNSAILSTTPDT